MEYLICMCELSKLQFLIEEKAKEGYKVISHCFDGSLYNVIFGKEE